MPVAGARALFTASRSHASTAPRVVAAINSTLSNKKQQLGARTFQTSSPGRSKPSEDPSVAPKTDENASSTPAANDAPSSEKKDEKALSTAIDRGTQSLPVSQKETTPRSQGYGSFRNRALRTKTVEETTPVTIPAWFAKQHVSTCPPLAGVYGTPLPEELLEGIYDMLSKDLERDMGSLLRIDDEFAGLSLPDRLTKKIAKTQDLLDLAYYYSLILVSPPEDSGARAELLNEYLGRSTRPTGVKWSCPWGDSEKPLDRSEGSSGVSLLTSSPFDFIKGGTGLRRAKLPETETELAAYLELLSRARHELEAAIPRQKVSGEPYRPVTLLSVLNYKGRNVARKVVMTVASELEADVLLLDARSIGLIVGTYLGQTPYWSKGPMSTLGYATAEMNGRLAAPAEAADDASEGTISFNIPVMRGMRSFPKKDLQALLGNTDERWEEVKMTHALEALVNMVDTQRVPPKTGIAPPANRPVIVHLSDYVEINALAPEVMQRLRALVDKLWQKGKRIIIIGSSSSDINSVSQWRAQLTEEISKDDCHVVPYTNREWAKFESQVENVAENVENIEIMLATLEGHSAETAIKLFGEKYRGKLFGGWSSYLMSTMKTSVFSVQTVYRLATLMLDSAKSRGVVAGKQELETALKFLDVRDNNWTQQYPSVPQLHPRGPGTNDNPQVAGDVEWEKAGDTSSGTSKATPQYNKEEKKLLTGLINAEDINTSFDDIVTPDKTKESIKALTSLSLIRPEAYTYGILKTDRIPGLLLYGPPGTGKTLLAKAVAKESGANMLEVSAASIMDMYVGSSEKNVQALFSLARKLAPTIIFLDEGDALLGARRDGWSRNAHREVITQFLREWDGLTNTNKNAFIIVATNRPFDLDEAVLRRLPRKMLIDLPLKEEREAILRILLKEESLDEATVSLPGLAAETDLYSGSDLKNLCVAAAMEAVKQEMRDYATAGSPKEGYVWPEKRILTRKHFDAAVKEIGASINEDMESLKAIRKFDERYGDGSNKQKRKKRSMGFEVIPATSGTEAARVRTVLAPAAP